MADNLTAIFELTACYRDSFTLLFFFLILHFTLGAGIAQ
jgi:hypothetical protein